MTGRPTKLNPIVHQKIMERLAAGSTIKATCDSVGIDQSTFHNWMNRGQAEAERRTNPHVREGTKQWEREQSFVDFFKEATRAQADGMIRAAVAFREGMLPSETVAETTETTHETRLRKDGTPYQYEKTVTKRTITHHPGDWRAAMEYLARRDPDNWARHAPQEYRVLGKDGGDLRIRIVHDDTND